MRWLNRLAATLTAGITGMSIFLILILAGSVGLRRLDVTHDAFHAAMVFGGYSAGLAWPLFAATVAAMLVLVALGLARRELRTQRRGPALLLGAIALHAAWLFDIRPPAGRTGVFEGEFVYGALWVPPRLPGPLRGRGPSAAPWRGPREGCRGTGLSRDRGRLRSQSWLAWKSSASVALHVLRRPRHPLLAGAPSRHSGRAWAVRHTGTHAVPPEGRQRA
jgi:hypothetical protein